MRIMMFSWEYPPKSVGGLAQHVYHLCNALVATGEEVHLITVGGPEMPIYEEVNGVKVHRVQSYQLSAPDFRTWIIQLNLSMLEQAISLINDIGEMDIIHAHDWLVAYAGRAIKHAYRLPLVATIHATEFGRNHGLHNDEQRYISDVEWWLTYEAWRVVVCSNYMEKELNGFFQLPKDKLRVIPNGVEPGDFETTADIEEIKRHYAPRGEKIIFFIGRLVQEKGVQVLLEAAPKIIANNADTKFIIAGKGPRLDFLKYKAQAMGIGKHVEFVGYVADEIRNKLFKMADVAVFPSLYEPFGIVALEGMATNTPVVVSDTGGLSEIVEHGVDGLKAYTGSASSLADNILTILKNQELGRRLSMQAFRKVMESYSWTAVARKTTEVYSEVISEHKKAHWDKEQDRMEGSYTIYDRIKNISRYSLFNNRTH